MIGRIIKVKDRSKDALVYFLEGHTYVWLSQNSLALLDRSMSIGDIVRSSDRASNVKGAVIEMHCLLTLKSAFDPQVVQSGISSREVSHFFLQQPYLWFHHNGNLGKIIRTSKVEIHAVSKSTGEKFTWITELPVDWSAFGLVPCDWDVSRSFPAFFHPGNQVVFEEECYLIANVKLLRFEFYWAVETHPTDEQFIENGRYPDEFFTEARFLNHFEYSSFSLGHTVMHQGKPWTVVGIESFADIQWQNGTTSQRIPSLQIFPLDNVEDLDFFPNDIVSYSPTVGVKWNGCILAVDTAANTLNAVWFDAGTRALIGEREVSIFSIQECPSFDFRISLPLAVNGSFGLCLGIIPASGMLVIDFDGEAKEVFFMDAVSTEFLDEQHQGENEYDSDDYTEHSDDGIDEYMDYSSTASSTVSFCSDSSWETLSEGEAQTEDAANSISQMKISFQNPAGRYLLESCAPSSHYDYDKPSTASPSIMRTISKEVGLLSRHLPAGIFVKQYEDRMNLLSLLILGPKDTPYEGCPFLFDVYISERYPNEPPKVFYLSFVSGKLNPNLYENGRICLSLLGTWEGDASESWIPGKSNLL